MPGKPVPNAKDILPKGLLRRLQRYCSGSIYIPAPQTQAQMNTARVRSLHSRGYRPADIARIVGMSAKRVRHIVRQIEGGGTADTCVECKICRAVPQEVVEAVQKHVFGRIYVPARSSQAERRRSVVQRLLSRGLSVSEVAKRSGLSERRVWQIKRIEAASKASVKAKNKKPQGRFDIDAVIEPGHTPPKRYCVCGIPAGTGEEGCEMCRPKVETRRRVDSDVITIHSVPFATVDRQF